MEVIYHAVSYFEYILCTPYYILYNNNITYHTSSERLDIYSIIFYNVTVSHTCIPLLLLCILVTDLQVPSVCLRVHMYTIKSSSANCSIIRIIICINILYLYLGKGTYSCIIYTPVIHLAPVV